jgi:hypothetical protein
MTPVARSRHTFLTALACISTLELCRLNDRLQSVVSNLREFRFTQGARCEHRNAVIASEVTIGAVVNGWNREFRADGAFDNPQ